MRKSARTRTGANTPALLVLDLPGIFLAAFSLLAISAVKSIPPGMIFFAAMAMIPGIYLSRRPQPPLYSAVWNRVAVGFVAAMVLFQVLTSSPPHAVLVYICVFLLMLRWFNPRGLREHVESWALTALLAMVGAMEGAGLLGIVLLLGWGTATVHLFHLLAVLRAHPRVDGREAAVTWRLAPQTFRVLPSLLVGVFVIAAIVLFVTPRAKGPSPAASVESGAAHGELSPTRTGFTETVTLTGLSTIHESDGVALRIADPPASMDPARLRLRVSTLDDFDGWRWRRTVDEQEGAAALARRVTPPLFSLSPDSAEAGGLHWLQIRQVDFRSSALAIPEGAVMIGGLVSDAELSVRADGRVESAHSRPPQRYQVWANRLGPAEGNPDLLGSQVLPSHLAVPPQLRKAVRRAATAILPPEGSVVEVADEVRTYFRRRGAYSLDLNKVPDGPAGLVQFLLENPEGHCELFASAMALVLREGGIPTRLVTGFVGAQPVSAPGGGLVREWVVPHRSAHAWVEVWTGEQWVSFDPTPAQIMGGAALSSVPGGLREHLRAQSDYLASFVVGYDYAAQQRLLRHLRSGSLSSFEAIGNGALLRMGARFARNIREPEMLVLLAGLLLVNLAAISLYLRSFRFRRLLGLPDPVPKEDPARLPGLLRDLLSALDPATVAKGELHLLATERIKRAVEQAGLPPERGALVASLYNQWRFGAGGGETERLLRREIRRLRTKSHPG